MKIAATILACVVYLALVWGLVQLLGDDGPDCTPGTPYCAAGR